MLPEPLDMSDPERALQTQLRQVELPDPEWYFRFHPERKWEFDAAYPALMLALEVEGGQWIYGRHNRPEGYTQDCRKYNTAALNGWLLLRFTPAMIDSGEAVRVIERAYYQRLEAME